jgi:hypothetical protein
LLTRDQPATVQRLDRNRQLHRVRPGVFARASDWAVLAPWERYLARVHAVARTWADPVFCLESAAALQGMPVFGEPRLVHLLSADGSTWHEGDVAVHGLRDGRCAVHAEGIRLTTAAETTLDLCRVLPPAFALAVADAFLRSQPAGQPPIDLSARGRAQLNRRGLRQLDWVQVRATGVAESVGESVSRAVIEWLGCEEPELQAEFRFEGRTDRADFFWRRRGIIGESDGYGKYDAAHVAVARAHFIDEKRREDRLRRNVGTVIRWDWKDTLHWRDLWAKLRAGGLVPVRPMNPAMLETLSENPRSLPR